MKKVIVPFDFSETSLNAARFAVQMFSGKESIYIILYSMFEHESEAETTDNYLDSLEKELQVKGNNTLECIKERGGDFIDSLSRLAQQKAATLIIMGITG